MRAFFALLLTAACATVAAETPASRVAGCWIARDGSGGATTMRWLRDTQRPSALHGDRLAYGADGATQSERYRLEPAGEHWSL
jgi:hypothetical protein